jgi:hypothetical protein
MTRKHFEQIALILNVQKADAYLIRAFAYMCAQHNKNFDYDKFYKASGLDA